MAAIRELRSSSHATVGGVVGPSSVVCLLNGSPPARGAAAFAASLSRALQWPLGLVASGLQPLDIASLATAVDGERAGLVVLPIESVPQAVDPVELAERTGVPVVMVPAYWRAEANGATDVVVHARDDMPELAGLATRMALALGAPMRLRHADRDRREVLGAGADQPPRLAIAAARDVEAASLWRGRAPLMLVPPSVAAHSVAA